MLWFMGLQRFGHDWVTELNWTFSLWWLAVFSIFKLYHSNLCSCHHNTFSNSPFCVLPVRDHSDYIEPTQIILDNLHFKILILVASSKSFLPYESERCSVMSNSLRPHGLHSPWNSPVHNIGVGSRSLLQEIFQPRNWTQISHIADGFFTTWATREALSHLPYKIALMVTCD